MIKKFVWLVLATAALTVSLVACGQHETRTFSPTPVAETTETYVPLTDDERYIGLLDQYNIYYSSEAAAISMAETICETHSGMTEGQMLRMLNMAKGDSDTYYSEDDVQALYNASVTVYCPQFS
ncbi:hypothetical protein SEA_LITTLEFELLA_45 [Gordonia phage LittleFella]|nr:hypothetical protein SEA_LITTLEFELLA_45 [Gordonia phage LittleFella]